MISVFVEVQLPRWHQQFQVNLSALIETRTVTLIYVGIHWGNTSALKLATQSVKLKLHEPPIQEHLVQRNPHEHQNRRKSLKV